MTPHSNTRGDPPKKPKKCRFCPIRHRFQPNWWVTAVFKMRRDFVGLSSSPDAELKTYVGLFEKYAYDLRYRGVSADLSRHNQKNWWVFRGQIWDLGGNILFPEFLVPLVDSEFNVDYGFAMKHGPIQSDDWDMDFCAMPRSCWAPKIASLSCDNLCIVESRYARDLVGDRCARY